MAQHFLLSKAARGLSLKRIFGLSDADALTAFREARWGKGRDPQCPHTNCRHVADHDLHDGRQRWRCNRCRRWFSVTSGTVFAYRKLPLQIYLAAMAIYTQHVKGVPALALTPTSRSSWSCASGVVPSRAANEPLPSRPGVKTRPAC